MGNTTAAELTNELQTLVNAMLSNPEKASEHFSKLKSIADELHNIQSKGVKNQHKEELNDEESARQKSIIKLMVERTIEHTDMKNPKLNSHWAIGFNLLSHIKDINEFTAIWPVQNRTAREIVNEIQFERNMSPIPFQGSKESIVDCIVLKYISDYLAK